MGELFYGAAIFGKLILQKETRKSARAKGLKRHEWKKRLINFTNQKNSPAAKTAAQRRAREKLLVPPTPLVGWAGSKTYHTPRWDGAYFYS